MQNLININRSCIDFRLLYNRESSSFDSICKIEYKLIKNKVISFIVKGYGFLFIFNKIKLLFYQPIFYKMAISIDFIALIKLVELSIICW